MLDGCDEFTSFFVSCALPQANSSLHLEHHLIWWASSLNIIILWIEEVGYAKSSNELSPHPGG